MDAAKGAVGHGGEGSKFSSAVCGMKPERNALKQVWHRADLFPFALLIDYFH